MEFPKRELQGPRPTPLKVRKDSHKIRKPPVAPPPAASQHHRHAPPQPPPPPVIIYTVSPKIIHTNPNEFMSLVQRLTGSNTTHSPSANKPSSSYAFGEELSYNFEAISPAARFASIERIKSSPDGRRVQVLEQEVQAVFEGIEVNSELQRITSQFPGILSPNPNALPPIPPSFFSPPSDNININNPLSFFHDLSPVLHSNRNHSAGEYSFILPSPSSFISPYGINMPSPNTLELFNSLFDL